MKLWHITQSLILLVICQSDLLQLTRFILEQVELDIISVAYIHSEISQYAWLVGNLVNGLSFPWDSGIA